MTQYKDKSAKQGESIPVGLFSYPILMAADILLYHTQLVPVGEDQKQHIELTRDIAARMNNRYSFGDPLFVIPEVFIPPVGARIMSLTDPTRKMSKSDPDPNSCIYLTDSDDKIAKKVRGATTDSGTEITNDPDRPGVYNLLTIQAAITGKSVSDLAASYAGKQYGHLKKDTADIVIQEIGPIRERATGVMADMYGLERVLAYGAEKARARAAPVLAEVCKRVGF
jgi:tryptophanyl-tRNA synthetase